MCSIVIENINGKILANPNPTKKIPINVRVKELEKIKRTPESAIRTVYNNSRFGAIRDMINEPKNLPARMGR
jgi:hypothetical protein